MYSILNAIHTLVQYYYSVTDFWTDFFESQDDNFQGFKGSFVLSTIYMPPLCSQSHLLQAQICLWLNKFTGKRQVWLRALFVFVNQLRICNMGRLDMTCTMYVFVRNKINRTLRHLYPGKKLYKIRRILLKVWCDFCHHPFKFIFLFLYRILFKLIAQKSKRIFGGKIFFA